MKIMMLIMIFFCMGFYLYGHAEHLIAVDGGTRIFCFVDAPNRKISLLESRVQNYIRSGVPYYVSLIALFVCVFWTALLGGRLTFGA